jgi:hypothetical protein
MDDDVQLLGAGPATPATNALTRRNEFIPQQAVIDREYLHRLNSSSAWASASIIQDFIYALERQLFVTKFRTGSFLVLNPQATLNLRTANSNAQGDPSRVYNDSRRFFMPARLLEFEVCFFAFHQSSHFALFAVCNAQNAHAWTVLDAVLDVQAREKRRLVNSSVQPAILVFDSLPAYFSATTMDGVAEDIRRLYTGELMQPDAPGRPAAPGAVHNFIFSSSNLPLHHIKCDRQLNTSDCGYFMLCFLHSLVEKWATRGYSVPELVANGLSLQKPRMGDVRAHVRNVISELPFLDDDAIHAARTPPQQQRFDDTAAKTGKAAQKLYLSD